MLNIIYKFLIISLITGILSITYLFYEIYEKRSRFYVVEIHGSSRVIDSRNGKVYKYDYRKESWHLIGTNVHVKNPFAN